MEYNLQEFKNLLYEARTRGPDDDWTDFDSKFEELDLPEEEAEIFYKQLINAYREGGSLGRKLFGKLKRIPKYLTYPIRGAFSPETQEKWEKMYATWYDAEKATYYSGISQALVGLSIYTYLITLTDFHEARFIDLPSVIGALGAACLGVEGANRSSEAERGRVEGAFLTRAYRRIVQMD